MLYLNKYEFIQETDIAMNFSECFASAKKGNKNSFAELYSFIYKEIFFTAYFSIKPADVETAVKSAAAELMSSLEKCDEQTFSSRAAKLLCMRIIPLFKHYREAGEKITYDITDAAPDENGIDLKQEMNKLTDLERLALILWTEFCFPPDVLSVVSGQKENIITAKLASAQEKIIAVIPRLADNRPKLRDNLKLCLTAEIPEYAKPESLFPAEKEEHIALDAKMFIKVIKAEKISGKEFLELIGNSRISNESYAEIEQNPQLTFNRLVEILEQSPLDETDYEKLLLAVKKRADAKKAALKQLEEAEKKTAEDAEKTRLEKEKALTAALAEREKQQAAESEVTDDGFVMDKTIHVNITDEDRQEFSLTQALREQHLEPENEQEKLEYETDDGTDDDDEDEDEHYKRGDEFDDDDVYYEGKNRPQIIVCFVLAAILAALSFGLRYYYTGSFLLTDKDAAAVPDEITDESGVYNVLSALAEQPYIAEKTDENYYINFKAENKSVLADTARLNGYVYLTWNNQLYMVKTISGKINYERTAPLPDGFVGMFTIGEKVAVVSAEENVTEAVEYWTEVTDEAGNVSSKSNTAEITRSRITIDFYNGKTLKKDYSYSQDGDLCSIFADENGIEIITSYSLDNVIKEAAETFMPVYYVNGEKQNISAADIVVPTAPQYKAYALMGEIDAELNADCTAVLGGSDITACRTGSETYLLLSGDKTNILRFTEENGKTVLNAQAAVDGKVTANDPLDSRNGIIRVVTSTESGTEINLLNQEMEVVSGVREIAAGKTCKGAAFDDRTVYVIAGDESGEQIYGFDTGSIDSPSPLETITASIYSEKLAAFGSDAVSVVAVPDESGNRTGLKLTMYSTDDSLAEKYSTVISVGEWSKYLSSDAETDLSCLVADYDSRTVILPIRYFDGISEIEKFLIYNCSDTDGFTDAGEVVLYDVNSARHDAIIIDGVLYTIWSDRIISTSLDSYTLIESFMLDRTLNVTPAQTEAAEEPAAIE